MLLGWIFTKNSKCWENFNHICSYRCSFVRNGSNSKNAFVTQFTRFKVMKKSPGSFVLSVQKLNFWKFCTFFHFQGSYSGYGRMPTVSSGRRRNLVSPTKHCDDLLLRSQPYAPFLWAAFLALRQDLVPSALPETCIYFFSRAFELLLSPSVRKSMFTKCLWSYGDSLQFLFGIFIFIFYCSEIFIEYPCVVWPNMFLHEPEPYYCLIF